MSKLFPDCNLHYMEQRTPEWFDIRNGRLTASEAGMWLFKRGTATAEKARDKAQERLLAQLSDPEDKDPSDFQNWAMRRGTELEPLAMAAFESATGKRVINVGFCSAIRGAYGCSPDSIVVDENVGVEGKVPVRATMIHYILNPDDLLKEYRNQVHFSMAVTGADAWHLQAWNPGLPAVRTLVHRDQFTEDLVGALREFSDELEVKRRKVAELWENEFKSEDNK